MPNTYFPPFCFQINIKSKLLYLHIYDVSAGAHKNTYVEQSIYN